MTWSNGASIEPLDPDEVQKELSAGVTLTATDRAILSALEPVVDAIATVFGSNCEVLIHSLENLAQSVMKIRNGEITGRKVGSPITDLGMRLLKSTEDADREVFGSYYTKTSDGKMVKSVTALIRNGTKPVGMLCININLSAPMLDVLGNFVPDGPITTPDDSPEHFVMSAEELVRRSSEAAIALVGSNREITPRVKNKAIVGELYNQGIFDVKGAVEIVAKELGVSRYTIYNYIRDARM